MDLIKEISSISNYQPIDGDVLLLFELMTQTESLNRREALEVFRTQGKSEARFRTVYQELKERLIGGIFSNSFSDYTTVQKVYYKIWKNQAAVRVFLAKGKRKAYHKLGQETFNLAIKYGVFDSALVMARLLISHYSTMEPDAKKFAFYKNAIFELQEKINDELLAECLNHEILFRIRKKKNMDGIAAQIADLESIKERNKEHKFNLYYYNIKSYYYQVLNDQQGVINNGEEAIAFFQTFNIALPYATTYSFYMQLAVISINLKEYEKAKDYIQKCLKYPHKGTYNWNVVLFLLAIIGFHSNDPQTAYEAWKKAQDTPKIFKSAVIDEQWRIILAYLVWYKKIGRLNIQEDYRLGKFLNEIDIAGKNKTGQNVAVIVAQMLHYLADNRIHDFEKKAGRLERYISTYLRKNEHVRSKNFLRVLRRIEDADYYLDRTEQKTQRYWNNIRDASLSVSVELLETEVVPFEMLWEDIKGLLR